MLMKNIKINEEYKDKNKRRDKTEDHEAICHKVAWSAVKKKYQKDKDGNWKEKNQSIDK